MKTKSNFFLNIFRKDSPESCKRVFGAIGFVVFIIYVGVFDHNLIDTLGYLSAGLIAGGMAETIFSKLKSK